MTAQNVYALFLESLKNRIAVEGVTQKDLAKRVETSKTHLNTVLKERKKAGIKLQKRLAAYFGLSLEGMTQEGYTLLHCDQRTDPHHDPERQAPVHEETFLPFTTQNNGNLTDLAMQVAAAAKRTQDDLARWQSIVEAIGDGVVIISAKDQVIEYQNQAHKDLFGGNLVGKKCDEIAACSYKGDGPTKRAVETGKVCYGTFTHDEKTISIIASPVRDASGRIVKVVTTSRDISERQKAINGVLVAEERLLGMISLLGLPVLIFDETGNLIFTNKIFRELTSTTVQDLVNLDTLADRLRTLIKDFDRVEMWMRTALRSQKDEQINVQYKTGRKSTWISRPIFSPSGRYLGVVCMSGVTTT